MRHLLVLAAAGLMASVASATPVLIDFTVGGSQPAAAADFTAAGVTEDISGASVINVGLTAGFDYNMWHSGGHIGGNASISVVAPTGTSVWETGGLKTSGGAIGTAGKVFDEGLYTDGNPTYFKVTGLNSSLDPNTDYKAYLFVNAISWDSSTHHYQMDYDAAQATGNVSAGSYLVLPFTTGATVADLTVTYSQSGDYPVATALAIVAVPEPAAAGLVAGLGGLLALRRRR